MCIFCTAFSREIEDRRYSYFAKYHNVTRTFPPALINGALEYESVLAACDVTGSHNFPESVIYCGIKYKSNGNTQSTLWFEPR